MGLRRSRTRAFTLIEAMIVVAIVGVLALLATLAYRRWVRTAHLSEAQDMVASIRAAEESFRAENGGYLSVSPQLGVGRDYPAATPGAFKTAWGGACGVCNATNSWALLNIQPSGPLAFGYSLLASNVSNTAPPNLTVNGNTVDTSAVTAPWYLIEADGDVNGDGVFTTVYGLSGTNVVYIDKEGE
jgi:prepilin-type N-terminal cleavage/methylation domain-containing protein